MSAVVNFRITNMSPQLLVGDIRRAVGFYTEKLGFTVEFHYGDFYSAIIKDGYSIHLKSAYSPVERTVNKRNDEDVDIIFSVEGIEGWYEELSARLVEFVQPLRDMPYGKEFYIADPDGNVIAFVEAL